MLSEIKVYEAEKWIGDGKQFIYSHALNRRLNPEERRHDFFEIIYLFSGFGEHRVNGSMQKMQAGDVCFLRPGDAHLFVEQSDQLELYSISAIPDEIIRFLETYRLCVDLLDGEAPPLFHMDGVQTTGVLKLFSRLNRLPVERERDAVLRVILGMSAIGFRVYYFICASRKTCRRVFRR